MERLEFYDFCTELEMLYRMFRKFGLIRNIILLCYGYSNVLRVIQRYIV